MVHVENWGRKKLAYEVKKQRKGNYVLLNYEEEAASSRSWSATSG